MLVGAEIVIFVTNEDEFRWEIVKEWTQIDLKVNIARLKFFLPGTTHITAKRTAQIIPMVVYKPLYHSVVHKVIRKEILLDSKVRCRECHTAQFFVFKP